MDAAIKVEAVGLFKETRLFPRVKRRLPVLITTAEGQRINTNIYDLSPEGLQVRCERDIAFKINPGGLPIDELNPVSATVAFPLPVADEMVKITINCEVSYVAIVPENIDEQFAVGLRFKKNEEQVISSIGSYVFDESAQFPQELH